jgi:nucleoside 2-deoxyribosyltransferase
MPLTPSERTVLIKEIADRLAPQGWSVIDLTLKQFSLPWSEYWDGGSLHSYVLSMIGEASDQSLIDLALHVGFQPKAGAPRLDPPFWQKDMLRVFVTHLAAHRQFAGELQQALVNYGISCFVAHNDIEPTKEWQVQIETALTTCDALVALLHQDFHQSNWTDQEIGFAMGRGVPVFSVRFDQDPYGFIGRFQAFQGSGKQVTKLAEELFDSYRKNKQTQHRMAKALVGLFEDSYSFARAKTCMTYLEELEVWEPTLSARLRSALKSNTQISQSFGVPPRIEALIKKWENKIGSRS